MSRACRFTVLVAAVAICGSCLSNDSIHDLYLDPDGRVVWTVTERDVRSSAERDDERRREERDYLEAVHAGDHAVARALWRVGARRVSTTVLRDERPYTVVTSGTFDGIDEALGYLLDGLGIAHEVELIRSGDGALLLEIAIEERDSGEPDESVLALGEGLGACRIVLTRGAFVEAQGFELEHDGTVARMTDPPLADGVARYRLKWRMDEP